MCSSDLHGSTDLRVVAENVERQVHAQALGRSTSIRVYLGQIGQPSLGCGRAWAFAGCLAHQVTNFLEGFGGGLDGRLLWHRLHGCLDDGLLRDGLNGRRSRRSRLGRHRLKRRLDSRARGRRTRRWGCCCRCCWHRQIGRAHV